MIKDNQLRKGNFVGVGINALHADGGKNEIYEISELKEKTVQFKGFHAGEFYEDIEPIALTDERLLKLGFSDSFTEFKINNFVIAKDNDLFYFQFENYQVEIPDVKLQYVHQLQNLYFCLCGEELELKLN